MYARTSKVQKKTNALVPRTCFILRQLTTLEKSEEEEKEYTPSIDVNIVNGVNFKLTVY